MSNKKKILFLIGLIVFVVICVLLYLDRLEVDGCIVFKTIQEFDTRLLLAINPDGDVFFLNAFFIFITSYLDIVVPVAIFILFLLSFYIERLKKYRFILFVVFMSYLICAFATGGLKEIFSRARPQRIEPTSPYFFGSYNPLEIQTGTTSFPSGHTSSAFSLMVPLIIYVKPKWLKGLFLTYACLQGISRMWVGVHFPSDVLVGALLGILISVAFYYLIRKVIAEVNPEDLRLN